MINHNFRDNYHYHVALQPTLGSTPHLFQTKRILKSVTVFCSMQQFPSINIVWSNETASVQFFSNVELFKVSVPSFISQECKG